MCKTKKIVISIFLLLLIESAAAQCAMCKAVTESGDAEMAEGINSGITYLMAFPYLLVGALAYVLYRYKTRSEN